MLPLPRAAVAAALAVLLATSCGEEPVEAPPADPFAAVVAARAAYADPIVTLRTEVAELQIAARRVRVEGLQDEALGVAVDDLDRRVADVRAAAVDVTVDPTAGLPDGAPADEAVLAAMAAWDDAVAAAGAAADAAGDEVAAAELLADVDARLDEVAAVWNEPGSRRQQLERFAAAADAADAIAVEVADAELGDPSCLAAGPRRVTAAETIAERTRELRDLVSRFRGEEFDQRRAEYGDDPDGLDPLAELDAAEAGCWDANAAVVGAGQDVTAAIEALQDALNPPAREVVPGS